MTLGTRLTLSGKSRHPVPPRPLHRAPDLTSRRIALSRAPRPPSRRGLWSALGARARVAYQHPPWPSRGGSDRSGSRPDRWRLAGPWVSPGRAPPCVLEGEPPGEPNRGRRPGAARQDVTRAGATSGSAGPEPSRGATPHEPSQAGACSYWGTTLTCTSPSWIRVS